MENYCAFSQDHKCMLWEDYDVTRYELQEANTLCHGNWIELQHKDDYIKLLQDLLSANRITFPFEDEV